MESWSDQGIVLSLRPHGESGAVVSVLTENHGRHAGYMRGAQSSKMRSVLEPGNLVQADWSSRVADNLGTYKVEPDRYLAAGFMDDALKLSAVLSACALCDAALPEREVHPGLFHGLLALLENMDNEIWAASYILWELAFLREQGFGVDLTRCAGGGDPQTLAYVSPKSGRAVSEAAAAPYKEKLLELPAFLRPQKGDVNEAEIFKGLKMTGHFLEHWVFNHHSKGVPEERLRFQGRYERELDKLVA